MAAPSGIVWGSSVNNEGRIGIYTSLSSTNTQTTVSVQIWFWSRYSVSDSNNTLYYNILASSGSATTSKGSVSVKTTVSTGDPWPTSNQIKLASYTHTYSRGESAATKYIYARLTNVDVVGAQMSASTTVSIPKLPTYTVSYNANGGSDAPSSQTKTYGKTLTLSSTKPTRTGYSFQGWATSASGSVTYNSGSSYTANASVTLYAVWKANTYTVSYNANGGSGAPSSQTKTYGKTLTLSSTKPTRTGHAFKNWNTNSGGTGTSYSAGASYTANAAVTLYAQWTANTYKVTYNANGGSGAPSDQTKTYGVTLTLSSTKPTRTNYTFKGWATSSNATTAQYASGASYTANAAITLYAVWELAYKKPTISGLTVTRCNSSGTASASGTYLKVAFSWTTFSATPTIKIFWKSPSTSETSATASASGTSGSVSQVVGSGAISTDSSYTVSVTVNDGKETATVSKTIVGGLKPISVYAQGKGIAFGKSAELSNYMDVGFKSRFRDNIVMDNQIEIFAPNAEGTNYNVFIPKNYNDNTVIGYGNYSHKSGNTHIYGNDVSIYVANTSTPGGFRPYYRTGDTFTVNITTAGYTTNSKKNVLFTIPFDRPYIGVKGVTVASANGFKLRQNNAYTHGSSSSAFTFPSSITVYLRPGVGLDIAAVFDTTTNAIDNAPIGVGFNGTVTFT